MKPRVGVIAGHSDLLDPEYITELIDEGIDLTYEEYILELKEQGRNDKAWGFEEIDETDDYYPQEQTYLIGDWKKNKDGKYEINKNGYEHFAGTYNSGTNIICIEWSKYTTKCHHTSPCYVMADGSGPCGDLDTKGDSVIAYTLPKIFFINGEEKSNR